MADDFYPFVDSGDPVPDNSHIAGTPDAARRQREAYLHPFDMESDPAQELNPAQGAESEPGSDHAQGSDRAQDSADANAAAESTVFATRIAIYDDMLSTPRVVVVQPNDPRAYLEEITNTVYRCMKEQGGSISLMVIRELVENFIHAHFTEPIVSILDAGNTIRFADQGPGINDKERAFEFGVTSANRSMKRYIRGTGAGLPMVQQYLENAGGAVSIEDNLGAGTVVTVSVDPMRVAEIEAHSGRGAAVRGAQFSSVREQPESAYLGGFSQQAGYQRATAPGTGYPGAAGTYYPGVPGYPVAGAYPPMNPYQASAYQNAGVPQPAGTQQPVGFPQSTVSPSPYASQQTTQQMANGTPASHIEGSPAQGGYPAFGYQSPEAMWPQTGGFAMPSSAATSQALNQGFQQPASQSMDPFAEVAAPSAAHAPSVRDVFLSERCLQALDFLAENRQCGPTELTNAFGSSIPTWSRELATLNGYGFVAKHGRKYFLTERGSEWIATHRAQG